MKFILVILVVGLLYSCESESSNGHSSTVKEEVPDSTAYYDSISGYYVDTIRDFFNQKIVNGHFNGVYLFAHGNVVIDSGYYGIARYESKDSINFNSAFQLASGSKPFTATAILKLIEQGKLSLDDSVHHILPELPYQGITIEMLLGHRGGLGNYIYFTEYLMKDSSGFLTNDGILNILQDTIPDIYYPPNKKFDYSNTGYAILASIVERVGKKPFKLWMRENIFEPCGMDSSFILDVKQELPQNGTYGHLWDYRKPGNDYLNGVVGDKGMFSTASDLLNFATSFFDGAFLDTTLMHQAIIPQNRINARNRSYGWGWRLINPESDAPIVYHTGWWQGYRTYFIRLVNERKTIIVLDNVKRGPFLGIEELCGLFSDKY